MGAIMAIGVAVANAILLVTFAEKNRKGGADAKVAARNAAGERLRPVLMTSLAMITGMIPMALGRLDGAARRLRRLAGRSSGACSAPPRQRCTSCRPFSAWCRNALLSVSPSLDPDDPETPFAGAPEVSR